MKPIIIIVSVVVIGAGAFWFFDYLASKRAFAARQACVGSLIRIRLAKAIYAADHGLTNGAVISEEIVWREHGAVERCHAGGHYSINAVGVYPSCSYTGVVQSSGRLWRHVWPEYNHELTSPLETNSP